MKRVSLHGLAALLALLALIAVRVHVEARRELRAAEAATAAGDLRNTMVHLRRAARWHAPLNSASDEALARLRQIAEQAEATEDTSTALYAWRAIRGASVASESLFTPRAEEAERAEQHIAALMARVDPPQIDARESVGRRQEQYLTALRDHGRPNRGALIAVWVGLVLFVLGLGGVAIRGVDAEDRPLRAARRQYMALSAAGFLLLTAGLALA
jgi:hypothetical protein